MSLLLNAQSKRYIPIKPTIGGPNKVNKNFSHCSSRQSAPWYRLKGSNIQNTAIIIIPHRAEPAAQPLNCLSWKKVGRLVLAPFRAPSIPISWPNAQPASPAEIGIKSQPNPRGMRWVLNNFSTATKRKASTANAPTKKIAKNVAPCAKGCLAAICPCLCDATVGLLNSTLFQQCL
jgi:hypothetical protein